METEQKQSVKETKNMKQMYIIGGVVVVIIIVLIAFLLLRKGKQQTITQTNQPTQQDEQIIPTVDSSVIVDITSHLKQKKFDVNVKGIPASTTSLEYEITYQTSKGGLPGYSSTVEIKSGQSTYEKKDFLLGTCSTGGTCTYDEVVGPLKVNIKFTGSYGDRLFSKDFDLNK